MKAANPITGGIACAAAGIAAAAEADAWRLVWADEFDKPGRPDPVKWAYESGFVRNGEAQYYTVDRPENARVEDGALVIEARKEDFPAPPDAPARDRGKSARFTAASLTTRGKFSFAYGRVEVRAKLPAGRGVWPAIWMLGVDRDEGAGWPRCGEIDIMEMVGWEEGAVFATCHWLSTLKNAHASKGGSLRGLKPSDDFHTYAAEWDAREIRFFYDGRDYFTFNVADAGAAPDNPFHKPFYLLVNFAVGGSWGARKGIDENIWPQRFLIDFVRVYGKGAK